MTLHIGEVANSVGLSLRTVRLYDEAGVASPSQRSDEGGGLYDAADVERLRLAKRLRPLELSLEEVVEVIDGLDELARDETPLERRRELVEELARVSVVADGRASELRDQLAAVEAVAGELRQAALRGRRPLGTRH